MLPGTFSNRWNAEVLPNDVYFYCFIAEATSSEKAEAFIETKKLVMVK